MAIPIGPWIETTLVLCAMIIFGLFSRTFSAQTQTANLGLATAAGAIGGILATGIGFSFPMLYFVDPQTFNSWLASPFYFSCVVTSLALAAGSFGLAVAGLFEEELIVKQQMPFPIGELVYKMIALQNQVKNAMLLAIGFITTTLLLYTQALSGVVRTIPVLSHAKSFFFFTLPAIILRTDLLPMFWAVGFVTGHVIAIPLVIGFLAKIFCLEPLYVLYRYGFAWLTGRLLTITVDEFSIAFCSGIVVYGVALSFIGLLKTMHSGCKNLLESPVQVDIRSRLQCVLEEINWKSIIPTLIVTIAFFSYFKFSLLAQLYLIFFTFLWTYQVLVIAGKIGLAPLGRFATFVMVPGMFLFNLTLVQITMVAAFVEIAVGVASDVLFGRKMANLASIEHKQIVAYQLLGLIVSSALVGIVFWLLISCVGIGPYGELPVNKAYTRALLISINSFDIPALAMGIVFGYLLKFTKVNPTLILGGILMPPQYSLMLILGGLSTYLVKDREKIYPLCSGMFAANSLWMLLKTFLSL